MKKLICNLGALALGVLASIMAFINMFGYRTILGDNTTWSEKLFGLFTTPDKLIVNEFNLAANLKKHAEYADTFRSIAMILAIIAIAAFVVLAIAIVLDFLNGKKSKMAGIKKLASIVLIIVAILFVVAVIVFTFANRIVSDNGSVSFAIKNWFAFLSVVIGFAGSGLLAMCAKK